MRVSQVQLEGGHLSCCLTFPWKKWSVFFSFSSCLFPLITFPRQKQTVNKTFFLKKKLFGGKKKKKRDYKEKEKREKNIQSSQTCKETKFSRYCSCQTIIFQYPEIFKRNKCLVFLLFFPLITFLKQKQNVS